MNLTETEIKDLDFAEVDFSVRTYNIVKIVSSFRPEIKKFVDLANLTPDDLLSFRNCGRKTVCEIQAVLEDYGLKLQDSPKKTRANIYRIYHCSKCGAKESSKMKAMEHCPPPSFYCCFECDTEYKFQQDAIDCSLKH